MDLALQLGVHGFLPGWAFSFSFPQTNVNLHEPHNYRLPLLGVPDRLYLTETSLGQVSRWALRLTSTNRNVGWRFAGGNIVVWGILLMLHAATDNFGAFFALRFLLGTFILFAHEINKIRTRDVQECASHVSHHVSFLSSQCSTRRMNRCGKRFMYQPWQLLTNGKATRISWFYIMVRPSVTSKLTLHLTSKV